MSEPLSAFGEALADLCTEEVRFARHSPERYAEMIERLASSLAFTIALAGGGDRQRIETLIQGVEHLITAEAVGDARLAGMLTALPKGRRP